MRRLCCALLAMSLLPAAAKAQTELGVDAGVVIRRSGGTLTAFQVPTSALRVGFHAGERVIFEPLVTFAYLDGSGSSVTALEFVPGLDFLLGDGGAYVRGEVAIAYASSGGNSNTDVGFGAALGTRKTTANGNALLRLEAGVQRWPDEFAALTIIRLLAGFSVIVG